MNEWIFTLQNDLWPTCCIGHGAFATKIIEKGAFIAEYKGDFITAEEGEQRLCDESGPGFVFFFGKSNW